MKSKVAKGKRMKLLLCAVCILRVHLHSLNSSHPTKQVSPQLLVMRKLGFRDFAPQVNEL